MQVQRLIDPERNSASSQNLNTSFSSKISCQQPFNQPLCEVHLHQNVRKCSKTNPNSTGKTPKKMDSNRKMETQKIPQCADEGGAIVVLVGGGATPTAGGEGRHGGGSAMVGRGTEQ